MKETKDNNSRFRVCFFGAYYEFGNQGCRALTASLVKLVVSVYPDADITLLYGTKTPDTKYIRVSGRDVPVHVINSRLSPKSKINQHLIWITGMAFIYALIPLRLVRRMIIHTTPWLAALELADFVGDIRAGDSFSDIYGLRRLIFGSLPALTAILMGKKIVMLPQTYGPYKAGISRHIAGFLLRRSKRVYARDMDSLVLIRDLLGEKEDNRKFRFCPDVAFTLETQKPQAIDILPPVPAAYHEPIIGINISGLLYNGGYTGTNMFGLGFEYKQFVIKLVEHFLNTTSARILLIPHVFSEGVESDSDACREVFNKCGGEARERLHLLEGMYNQFEIKHIIGLCKFFIGSRMHSCIAGLSQGIPSVGIAYSKKFIGVFKSAGFGDFVVDAREKSLDDTVHTCELLFSQCSESAPELERAVIGIKKKVTDVFTEEFTCLK